MSGRPHYDARSETRRLVDHLAGEEHRIPREALTIPTSATVPGWRVIKGPGRGFSVLRPGHDEVVLTRDELVQVLRAEWVPLARGGLGGRRDVVVVDLRHTQARAPLGIPAPARVAPRRWSVVMSGHSCGPSSTVVEADSAFEAAEVASPLAHQFAVVDVAAVTTITITEQQ